MSSFLSMLGALSNAYGGYQAGVGQWKAAQAEKDLKQYELDPYNPNVTPTGMSLVVPQPEPIPNAPGASTPPLVPIPNADPNTPNTVDHLVYDPKRFNEYRDFKFRLLPKQQERLSTYFRPVQSGETPDFVDNQGNSYVFKVSLSPQQRQQILGDTKFADNYIKQYGNGMNAYEHTLTETFEHGLAGIPPQPPIGMGVNALQSMNRQLPDMHVEQPQGNSSHISWLDPVTEPGVSRDAQLQQQRAYLQDFAKRNPYATLEMIDAARQQADALFPLNSPARTTYPVEIVTGGGKKICINLSPEDAKYYLLNGMVSDQSGA